MINPQSYETGITYMIDNINNSNNKERLELAKFLIKNNEPIDLIVSIFKEFPDFNENVCRFQIQYLINSVK